MLAQLSDIASRAPIVVTNPGARPPATPAAPAAPSAPSAPSAPVGVTEAPPRVALALTPDVDPLPGDPLAGVDDDVDWTALTHAHGPADDVPRLLRAVADPAGDWDAAVDELIGDDVLHQGSCYAATAPAMRYVARIVAAGVLPAAGRVHLAAILVWAGSAWASGTVLDGVAAGNREPERHTADVRTALAAEAPRLLARWAAEPPAMRYVLAALGTLTAPQAVDAGAVAALAAEHAGTQQAAYLELAGALLDRDEAAVLASAEGIAAWAEDVSPAWLQAPAPLEVKAAEILALGVLSTAA